MWLDREELDELEDTVLREDEAKGTLVFAEQPTNLPCPHCGSPLRQFHYRLYDLTLEHCPNGHGFWLEAQEDERVRTLMHQRLQDNQRSRDAEEAWAQTLKRLKSPRLIDRILELLRDTLR
jgi:Zn-finger nucleic acid-binding protein